MRVGGNCLPHVTAEAKYMTRVKRKDDKIGLDYSSKHFSPQGIKLPKLQKRLA